MSSAPRASTRTIYSSPEGGAVRRTVLPGGLRVISERMPGALSVSFGVWVGAGSIDETPKQTGAAHYLEHLLFKGTTTRSAMQISAEIDAVGGEMNAFTSKEHTCYYATVLASDLPLAVDVITDVVRNPTMRSQDIDVERQVVLEELAMRDDDPADLVHDVFAETLFGARKIGRPIIGDAAHIQQLARPQISALYRKHYRPENLVVAAAGAVDHAELVRLVRTAFAGIATDATPRPVRRTKRAALRSPAGRAAVVHRASEQAHLILGMPGIDRFDERRFAMSVMETALGGGMSSRLFQDIREKHALAYTVYAFSALFAGDGMFGVYAGTAPPNARRTVGLIQDQLRSVARDGLEPEEVERAKGQVKGNLVLGLEDPGARMSRLGRSELAYGDHADVPWLLDQIDAVTAEDVAELAADVLTRQQCLAVVGPFRKSSFDALLQP